jgi:glycosyltransferase involved in cell wall biosynthesis
MKSQQIICILGMHRSGTSLVSRILNILGVYLGPEAHIMQPGPDNPKGYWEHYMLTALNDEILARLGGSWHEVPVFPAGWEVSSELADLRQRARAILQEDFATADLWGWKDPRTCLTLPFWQRLLPPMRYVICLRNPVDVSRSLERRDNFPFEKGVQLWLAHVTSVLRHTTGQPRLFVFYEDLMEDWPTEIKRLANFLGKPELAEEEAIRSAIQEFIEEELQHHRTSLVDAIDEPKFSFPAKALYVVLRAYAMQQKLDFQPAIDLFSSYAVEAAAKQEQLSRLVALLQEQVRERDQAITQLEQERLNMEQHLQAQLGEREQRIEQLEGQIAQLKAEQERLTQELTEKERAVHDLSAQLAKREEVVRQLEELLAQIQAEQQAEREASEAKLQTIAAEQEQLARQLEGQIAQLKAEQERLTQELTEKERAVHDLSAQLAKREEVVRQLEELLAQIQAEQQAERDILQRRLGWKRYLIADKLAAFYWYLRHPKQLLQFAKNRAWQLARQWLPVPVKFWIKRVILRHSPPPWHPPQPAQALDQTDKEKQAPESLVRTPIIITHKMEEIATKVSVVIPTKNAASEDFESCLRGITQQKGLKELEIIVVDSGSNDDTVEIAKSYGAKIFSIPPEQFDHGATRNYGGDHASGELLVFTVHDAVPASDDLFYVMAQMLLSDPKLAAVSVRQIPRSNADLFACWQIWNHYQYVGCETRISDIEDPKKVDAMSIQELRRAAGLDDVCSMHRKSIWDKLKYQPTDFAEDLEYGIRCLKAKYKIGFLGDRAIIHSHNRPAFYHLSKYYIDTRTLFKLFKDKDTDSKKWEKIGISTIDQLFSCAKDLYYALNRFSESIQTSALYEPTGFSKELQDFLLKYHSTATLLKGEPTLDKFFSYMGDIFEYNAPETNPCRDAFLGNIKSISSFLATGYPSLSGSELLDLFYKTYAMVVGADLGHYYNYQHQQGLSSEKLDKLDNFLRRGILR